MTNKSHKEGRRSLWNALLYLLFGTYNFVYLGFIAFASASLFSAPFFLTEAIPWNVVFVVYILALIPIVSLGLAAFTHLRKEPRKLAMYLFAVEIPIVVVSLLRLMFIRQMTGIYWLMFISVLVAMLGFVIFLLKDKFKSIHSKIALFLSQEIALIIGFYFAILVLFFLPIILAIVVKGFINIPFEQIGRMFVYTKGLVFFTYLFFLVLFCLSVGLFIVTPILGFIFYWKSFKVSKKTLQAKLKAKKVLGLQWGFGVGYVLLSILLAVQFHGGYDSGVVDRYMEAESFQEQQVIAGDLILKSSVIKSEFRDKYLAPYRYFIDNDMSVLERGYKKELSFSDEMASGVQSFFNVVALPFVYQRDFEEDLKIAKVRYEKMFDQSLQEGEKMALLAAMRATNTQDQLKAGIFDSDKETVRLVSRTVEVDLEYDEMFAKVSIEEEYENVSDSVQEIYYEFSLPEEAVVTDLRLGPNLEYAGVIAPKGAARTTYSSQVRRMTDPALLEQIGPRQYRLRVFPIPVKPDRSNEFSGRFVNRQDVSEDNQKVQFQYYVYAASEDELEPRVYNRRNLFEDSDMVSNRLVRKNGDTRVDAFALDYCNKTGFTVNTDVMTISFLPHHSNPDLNGLYDCSSQSLNSISQIQGKTIALLLDASYSSQQNDWPAYLQDSFSMEDLQKNNRVDGFFFTDYLSAPLDLNKGNWKDKLSVVNFGSTNRLRALMDVPDKYDVVMMFTDGSDNDQKPVEDFTKFVDLNQQLYLIHDSEFPQYRDELTMAVYGSGGGVYESPKKALEHLLLSEVSADQDVLDGEVVSVNGFGVWVLGDGFDETNDLSAGMFANFQIYRDLVKEGALKMDDLETIHKIAVEYGMVTPYSSYIALVTSIQKSQLERASNRDGKFNANYDVGNESISDPSVNNPLRLGSVPEPEEWALLIVGMLLIAYVNRRKILEVVVRR